MFDITLENVPLVNLRCEFRSHWDLLELESFRRQVRSGPRPPRTPYLAWFGMEGGFLTLLLQRAISGIESYIPAAVMIEAARRGRIEPEDGEVLRNPFVVGGRGTADVYYHRVPAKLCEGISLKLRNPRLWEDNLAFYKQVRNPIFHGKEPTPDSVDGVREAFRHIARLYEWIDSWHDADSL